MPASSSSSPHPPESSSCDASDTPDITNKPALYTVLSLLAVAVVVGLWTGAYVSAAYSGGILASSASLLRSRLLKTEGRETDARRWEWAGIGVSALVFAGALLSLAHKAGILPF